MAVLDEINVPLRQMKHILLTMTTSSKHNVNLGRYTLQVVDAETPNQCIDKWCRLAEVSLSCRSTWWDSHTCVFRRTERSRRRLPLRKKLRCQAGSFPAAAWTWLTQR